MGWPAPLLVTARDAGKAGSILNVTSRVAGNLAPIVTGYVVSIRHSYAWAFGIAAILFAAGIAAYVVPLGRIELPQAKTAGG